MTVFSVLKTTHFMVEKTQAQRNTVTSPQAHSWQVLEQDFSPSFENFTLVFFLVYLPKRCLG